MDHRFVGYFAVVTGLLAAAVYLSGQAAAHGGLLLSALAGVTGLVGILGFIALAWIVVSIERENRG